MKTSVIIRTRNEGILFTEVLSVLQNQTYTEFEIIQVDNESSDGTESVIYKYFSRERIKQIKITKQEFSHAHSCNIGAEPASGELLVYLNGHSIPSTYTWLEDGIKNFEDKNVAGVFAWNLPSKNANIIEKIFYNFFTKILHGKKEVYKKSRMGLLATTSAIIRKNLWIQYPFSKEFGIGGEDMDWGAYWMNKGYVVIQDPKFRTHHSHNLSFIGLAKQYISWKKMMKPSKLLSATFFSKT